MVVLGRRKKRVLFFLYSQIIHLTTRFLGIGMIATLHYTNGMVFILRVTLQKISGVGKVIMVECLAKIYWCSQEKTKNRIWNGETLTHTDK